MDSATGQHQIRAPLEPAAYRFCGFALDPARGVLRRPDGTEVVLRPKSTEVLGHLARNPTRLVSRDDLMEAVWSGVIVTDDSITQCVTEIRRALGDEGAPLLRTLPRRGYTLAAEVTNGDESLLPPPDPSGADGVAPTTVPASDPREAHSPAVRPRRATLAAAPAVIGVILASVAGYWMLRPATPPTAPAAEAPAAAMPAPRARSLVVLPFASQDGDPELNHLAAGITEDLTTALGRRLENVVVGSGTATAYRGQAVDARRIGLELGVLHVVQGSLRRLGPMLRVNVRLLDATTGAQLWAETLDRPFAEFAMLSRTMTLRLETTLHYRLLDIQSERAGAELPRDPTVPDLILRANAQLTRAAPREGMEQARSWLQQALALDDGSADAHALLAHVAMTFVNSGWADDEAGTLGLAEHHVARALGIDPRHLRGHYVRGMIRQNQRRFDEASAEYDLVIDALPSWAVPHMRRGFVKVLSGRPADGLPDIIEATRISPQNAFIGEWYSIAGLASLMLGRDEDALGHYLRSRATAVHAKYMVDLASAYALVGRSEEARATLSDHLRAYPNRTMNSMRAFWFGLSENPLYRATRQRQLDALRAIGMPEE